MAARPTVTVFDTEGKKVRSGRRKCRERKNICIITRMERFPCHRASRLDPCRPPHSLRRPARLPCLPSSRPPSVPTSCRSCTPTWRRTTASPTLSRPRRVTRPPPSPGVPAGEYFLQDWRFLLPFMGSCVYMGTVLRRGGWVGLLARWNAVRTPGGGVRAGLALRGNTCPCLLFLRRFSSFRSEPRVARSDLAAFARRDSAPVALGFALRRAGWGKKLTGHAVYGNNTYNMRARLRRAAMRAPESVPGGLPPLDARPHLPSMAICVVFC